MSQNELYHHGIDGQRWGVRHGPPYPLDRADHNKVIEKSEKASKKRNTSYSGSRKYAKRMSDKDLNDTIDRLQREETYRRLVSKEKMEKKAIKAAKKANKKAEDKYKNQNELDDRKQTLEEKKFNQAKKANRISHKVINDLLTNAAKTIGTNLTAYLINKHFTKEAAKEAEKTVDNAKKEVDKTTDTVKKALDTNEAKEQLDKLYEKQKELETKITFTPSKTYVPKVQPTLPNYKQTYDVPSNISEWSDSQINQALIDMYDGIYWSDESEGACL